MADGIPSRESRTFMGGDSGRKKHLGVDAFELASSDPEKLAAIRQGINVHVDALVRLANRIHDNEMRDAALGNIVKRYARYVENSPVRMGQLKYEKIALREIADMMADEAKRKGMFAFIEEVGSKK